MALGSAAEELGPTTLVAPEYRARVVDPEGKPLAGARILVRWEFERYVPASLHRYDRYEKGDEPFHVVEAVSSADGSFVAPGSAPKVRMAAKLIREPAIAAFKSGYLPFTVREGRAADRGVIVLAPAKDDLAYAHGLADFQAEALEWEQERGDWRFAPGMIDALQQERDRLSEVGDAMLGRHLLPGPQPLIEIERPGIEEIKKRRQFTGSPWVVVSLAWEVAHEKTGERKRLVRQFGLYHEGEKSRVGISPYHRGWAVPRGWRLVREVPPAIRVYAHGYRSALDVAWREQVAAIRLDPMTVTRDVLLAELRQWHRDIEADLARADTLDALVNHRLLARMLMDACLRLTMDARAVACPSEGSPIALAARQPPFEMAADRGRPRSVREQVMGTGSPIGAVHAVPDSLPPLGELRPVGGFRLVPLEGEVRR